ncbi:MAG: hypothetical protein ACLUHA_07395 [Bacteroides stercoris]
MPRLYAGNVPPPTGVYSQVPVTLGEVTANKDALTQNAYLHSGCLAFDGSLFESRTRRVWHFEHAASDADLKIKEQGASHNNVSAFVETSYSGAKSCLWLRLGELPE